MRQFTTETIKQLLEKYNGFHNLKHIDGCDNDVVKFMKAKHMRVIYRKDIGDYVFYSLDANNNVNFSLDKDSLNQPNTKEILESFYSQKD